MVLLRFASDHLKTTNAPAHIYTFLIDSDQLLSEDQKSKSASGVREIYDQPDEHRYPLYSFLYHSLSM
jgi:hypothetical protein